MTATALITRLWVLFGLWHASFPSKDVYAARGCFNRVEETSRVTQLNLSSVTPMLSLHSHPTRNTETSSPSSFVPFFYRLLPRRTFFYSVVVSTMRCSRRVHKCRLFLHSRIFHEGKRAFPFFAYFFLPLFIFFFNERISQRRFHVYVNAEFFCEFLSLSVQRNYFEFCLGCYCNYSCRNNLRRED